jgi:UDP-N-acetylglucosamine diphosphorylase/glucosamine-1-phosphate N-acetyltransferase
MKCVVLAAGEGKRMHPLTFTRPKVMIPVAGKPLLEWNLLNARKAGLKNIILIVGYKSETVRNYFGKGEGLGVKIEYINQGRALGTAHAIGLVEKFVDDDFIVLCGDTIFGIEDIKKIIKKDEASIGLVKVENASDYGCVDLKGTRVTRINEKIDTPTSNIINAGIYRFDKKIFKYIKKTGRSIRGEFEITDSINMLVKKEKMNGVLIKEWNDIVYPWHLLRLNEEILKKIRKKIEGEIERNVTIKGDAIINRNTRIMNGTYIEGPVIIGENCKIGPNCYIRPYTTIGDNCHVGNACEIKNTIIMTGSNIPHQNYVGDSIIGENCNLGAGTKVANLRLDKREIKVILDGKNIDTKLRKLGVIMGDNVQTGINSMINTGTIIGNNVFIGPGTLVKGYIEPNSRII